ncbi:MAG: hypothetical protein IJC34_07795, partial [Lentisphaeria bacterium]|nr:hypothetical protein [Lentisphaeria bacterium]
NVMLYQLSYTRLFCSNNIACIFDLSSENYKNFQKKVIFLTSRGLLIIVWQYTVLEKGIALCLKIASGSGLQESKQKKTAMEHSGKFLKLQKSLRKQC